MIATILPSSNKFHAVAYNEQKVKEGKAELVEMLNFGYISNAGKYTSDDLVTFLNDYSARMTEIGDKWREFSYRASKVIRKRSDETYTFDQLADFLQEIGEQERDFFRSLYAAVKDQMTE